MTRATLLLVVLGVVHALRVGNKTNSTNVVVQLSAAPVTQKDVDAESSKLEKMSAMLGNLLKSNSLSHSKVAPALKLFASNLESVLNETKSMKPVDAMKKLAAARAGVAGLVHEMTQQQESLMKEDFEQQESLLVSVLLTHKQDAMSKQLEILKSDDFVGLDVAKALLRSNDTSTPLYMQAAKFLDVHKNAAGSIIRSKVDSKESMAAALDKRVVALERDSEHREKLQKKRIEEFTALAKKGGKGANRIKMILKREEHNYKKSMAQSKHDIENMKAAADAIRKGDVKALDRARAALMKSLEAMKSKNAGMLVFLQEGNTLLETDCPYCVAQCVEKCHNKGEPYVSCLTECADAGK